MSVRVEVHSAGRLVSHFLAAILVVYLGISTPHQGQAYTSTGAAEEGFLSFSSFQSLYVAELQPLNTMQHAYLSL